MTKILAIDFETANHDRDSACAVGLCVVEQGRIVDSASYLIRPPSSHFVFTHIHGLTWEDVKDEPSFSELWPTLKSYLDAVDYFAAHNAAFDKGVLRACCESNGLPVHRKRFICTVDLARSKWGIYPTKLRNRKINPTLSF